MFWLPVQAELGAARGVAPGCGVVQQVYTGLGCLAQLPAELEQAGTERVLVIVGPTISRTELYSSIRRLLMPWVTDAYVGAIPHVPVEAVVRGVAVARRARPDVIVAVGGGSAVDLAKGIVVLGVGGASVQGQAPMELGEWEHPPAIVVVGTTLSQAEFTDVVGITTTRGNGLQAKEVLRSPLALPRVVFLDGKVGHSTPASLWLSTGFKALDTAIGELVRGRVEPRNATGTRLRESIAALHLGLRTARRRTPVSDQRLQTAAWQALYPRLHDPQFATALAQPWLGSVMRHQIGAITGAPHGMIASAVLPVAIRLHADLGLGDVSRVESPLSARGIDAVLALVGDLAAALELPGTLADLGVEPAQLPLIADAMEAEDPRLRAFRQDILHRMGQAL